MIRSRRARELLGVALLLSVLLVAFFSSVIFRTRVLSPADVLLLFSPWRHDAPEGFVPANALMGDYVFALRPWRMLASELWRAGTVPLWDPYGYAGAPLMANGQSAVFYPLNLPFLFLPEAPAVLLWAASRVAVAGLLTYAFARVIGQSPLAAVFAAVAYAFSGFFVAWLLWPNVSVGLWLPGLLLGVEAVLERATPGRVVALAGATAMQFFGGHPETSLHILSVTALYVVWRATALARRNGGRAALRRLAAIAGAGLLGTAGAAIQLLPLAEAILGSAAFAARVGAAPSVWDRPPVRWLDMLGLICPDCFGSWRRGDIPWDDLVGVVNFNELSGGYAGVATLVLAGLAIGVGPRGGPIGFFAVLGAVAFCVVYRVPPISNVVQALPLYRISLNHRAIFLIAFALALLAGHGLDRVLGLAGGRAARLRPWLVRALSGVAVALVAGLCYVAAANTPEAVDARVGPHGYDRLVTMLVNQTASRLAFLGATGLVVHAALGRPGRRRALLGLLPAILVIDLFAFGRDYTPAIPPRLDYPSHPAIDFLRTRPRPFRILPLEGQFPPNSSTAYGLEDVRGFNALENSAYLRLLEATGPFPRPYPSIPTFHFDNYASRLVDLLNVKYVLSDRLLDHPKLALAWEGRGVRVYENRAVLPRAFLVYRARAVPGPAAAEAAVRDPDFDPGGAVVLEALAAAPALGPPDPAARAGLVAYTPNRVGVEVTTGAPAVLVLADAWFPGWEATVDGVRVPVWRADLALRAVPVPAGARHVVFEYRPLSFRAGLALTGLATGIAGGLLGIGRVRARRRERAPAAPRG